MEMEKQQFDQVDRNIKEAQEKLEQEMEAARHEHQVMLMRQGESKNVTFHFLQGNTAEPFAFKKKNRTDVFLKFALQMNATSHLAKLYW